MSKKKLDITVLGALILLGVFYLYTTQKLDPVQDESQVSPLLFPSILGLVLIGLSLISLFKSFKTEDEKVDFPGMKKIIITTGMIVAYLLAWQYIGYFYILTFLLMFLLFTIYRLPLGMKASLIVTNILVSAGITTFIYVLFSHFMYVDF